MCLLGQFFLFSRTKIANIFIFFAEKFGGIKKVRIFAARLRENGLKSSLKRLITVQEASTEKNTIYREALISLEIMKCQRQAKNYIMIIQ